MSYFHNQGEQRVFFPSSSAGYPVDTEEERWMRSGLTVLIALFWVVFGFSAFLIVRAFFAQFPPIAESELVVGIERWRYLGPFLGGWALVWLFSASLWSRIWRSVSDRERVVIHDLKISAGSIAYQLLQTVRPVQIFVFAAIMIAFLFQAFGDVCFLYRGIGHCEIVKFDTG